jgi:hypothetical protein
MMKGREIIVYLAIKYHNEWNAIYKAIQEKELVKEEDLRAALSTLKGETVTIIDEEYPEEFKKIIKPPFVIFLSEEDRKAIGDESSQPYLDIMGASEQVELPVKEQLEEFIVKMYVDDILWDEFELFAGSLKEAEDILESSDFEIEEAIPGAFYNGLLLDAKGKELFRAEQLAGGDEGDIEMFLKTVQFDVEPRNDNMGNMDA